MQFFTRAARSSSEQLSHLLLHSCSSIHSRLCNDWDVDFLSQRCVETFPVLNSGFSLRWRSWSELLWSIAQMDHPTCDVAKVGPEGRTRRIARLDRKGGLHAPDASIEMLLCGPQDSHFLMVKRQVRCHVGPAFSSHAPQARGMLPCECPTKPFLYS
jgi:hypothetical protein